MVLGDGLSALLRALKVSESKIMKMRVVTFLLLIQAIEERKQDAVLII
jgi:hypothetical protein